MNASINGKQYLEHMAGIANLLEWIIVNERDGYRFVYERDRLVLDEQVTRRFLIGVPKNKKFGQHPFIAAQKREAVFLRLLNITRAIVREGDQHLHLVVSGVRGDGQDYPDLPPFVLSLGFDHPDKGSIIAESNRLDCRGFWIDDNEQIEIGAKAVLWNKPLLSLPATMQLLDDIDRTEGPSFEDLIRMKIDATNVINDPGFVRG
jgi:hypothetical protein